ncbi:MAG: interleukin-like EMT inducer domain-containing protein, partial [Ignavibacteria bacterium]
GWSFSGAGNQINKYILQGLSQDTIRRLGSLVKYANNIMLVDSSNFQVRNMINCYNLQGDPASKLLLPVGPEFYIGQTDYRISNQYPLVGEAVTWKIFPKNYGLYAKSCLVRFEILKNGGTYRSKDTTITDFKYYDTLSYSFSIDTIGNYSLKATLDYDNQYPNEDPSNNVITLPLPLRNISYTPLKPINNSIIITDSVEFVGLNPQVDLRTNSVKVILEVDTNRFFSSPVLNYSNSNISGVATKVRYRIPVLDSNLVYYWRTNSIINGDSAGWSETEKFVYNPLVAVVSSRSINSDSIVTLYPKLFGQFNPNTVSGLYYTGTGFKLISATGPLEVKSYGSNGSEASYFIIKQYASYADGGENTGMNVAKVRKLTGSVVEIRNFRMSTSTSSDSVLNFLNTFDTTHFVMIMIATNVPGSDSLRQNAKNRIKQFGSLLADSVTRFDQFDSYAFIGYLGAQPQDISEQFHRFTSNFIWTPSFANKTPVFLNTLGTIDFSIGPAHRWKYFEWNRILPPGSSVNFDVTGINVFGTPVPLFTNISTNNFTSLDTVNSSIFPDLKLRAKIEIDSLAGLTSPEFRSLYFKYTPPAEIIPDNYSFIRSDSVVNEGAVVTINARNYNIGFVPAQTVVYKWSAVAYNGLVVLRSDTITTPLQPDSSYLSTVTFNTQGLRNPQTTLDTLDINFEVSMLNNQNDYYPFNNFAFTKIVIAGDSTGPSIDVTYDGNKILDGDIIRAKPEILFRFYDDSKLEYSIADTTGIFIKLDGKRIYYNFAGQLNPEITFTAVNDGSLKTSVLYKPELTAGSHQLQYIGTDMDGNKDTLMNNIYISYDFAVRNLFNYPNPMQGETYFTFDLFAPDSPQSCVIKIFTVAGRLIKDVNSPAHVGFNQIYWDGKDNDGETIANGIYLYKLILEGNGKTETSIQKLAVLK